MGRERSQAVDVERAARRLDLPRGAHQPRAAEAQGASRCSSARCPRPGIEVRTFGTLGGGVLCEVFLDDVVIPAEYLVGELDRGWDVLMYTLDFERVTAEKIGGFAWVIDALEARLRETDRLDAAARARMQTASRPGAGGTTALVQSSRRTRSRRSPRARSRRWRSSPAERSRKRSATRRSTCSGSRGSRMARPKPRSRVARRLCTAPAPARRSPGGTSDVQKLVIARRGLGLR